MKRAPREQPAGGVRRELAELGRGARKRLGQHFLARQETARRIVDLARLNGTQRVVEIGPGLGALTGILVAAARELWLIELDADLAARLRAQYAGHANIHIVEADVLQVDFAELLGPGEPAVVVANLPYNIATAILARLLEQRQCFSRFVVMMQREVAERLRAVPGTKAYSALSVLTQLAARVERGLRLGPGAFVPPPKVESEVVVVTPYAQSPVPIDDVDSFTRLVRTVFTQRRKQLINSLRPLSSDPSAVLRAAAIDPARRPETLSLAEFAALSAALRAETAPAPIEKPTNA